MSILAFPFFFLYHPPLFAADLSPYFSPFISSLCLSLSPLSSSCWVCLQPSVPLSPSQPVFRSSLLRSVYSLLVFLASTVLFLPSPTLTPPPLPSSSSFLRLHCLRFLPTLSSSLLSFISSALTLFFLSQSFTLSSLFFLFIPLPVYTLAAVYPSLPLFFFPNFTTCLYFSNSRCCQVFFFCFFFALLCKEYNDVIVTCTHMRGVQNKPEWTEAQGLHIIQVSSFSDPRWMINGNYYIIFSSHIKSQIASHIFTSEVLPVYVICSHLIQVFFH